LKNCYDILMNNFEMMKRAGKKVLLIVLILSAFWLNFVWSSAPQTNTTQSKKTLYKVVKVIDGDTITVEIDGKKESIRMIGIDTPEMVDPRKSVQCFAKEASNKTKMTLNGKNVFLSADISQGDRDKYNRLLRYVFLEDNTNFNKLMISEGYAHEYTYNIPYKYQQEFKQAEKEARENKRGLWANDACALPVK